MAYKVHVQSGLFSFVFEHRRNTDDSGLGMITPMNEPHLNIPNGVRTRMILYLLESCDRDALRKDFVDLPDTLLIFLRKLKKLSVRIELFHHPHQERIYTLSISGKRATIHKAVVESNSASSRNYWIAKRSVTDMPSDSARKNVSNAEVVLAFPLDAKDAPIVEEQHVFAFLPLRKVGFKV